jgi:hypothetical protein
MALAAVVVVALLVWLAARPAAAAPMLLGQDTRDVEYTPHFNFTRVTVHPGERGSVEFTLKNSYNQTILAVRALVEFKVGGNWLTATPIDPNDPSAPAFDTASPPPPPDVAENETVTFSFPFTTKAGTPGGPYLIAVSVFFSYRNASNEVANAVFKSMGALSGQERSLWNATDYRASLNATGIDGLAPDTAILVDRGEAPALFWTAVFGGAIFFMIAYAVAEFRSRRPSSRRRKGG